MVQFPTRLLRARRDETLRATIVWRARLVETLWVRRGCLWRPRLAETFCGLIVIHRGIRVRISLAELSAAGAEPWWIWYTARVARD